MIVCLNFKCKNKQNLWERERFFWFKVVQGVDCDTFFQNCHESDKVNLSGEDGATFGIVSACLLYFFSNCKDNKKVRFLRVKPNFFI